LLQPDKPVGHVHQVPGEAKNLPFPIPV
jgi:hypothetical protein